MAEESFEDQVLDNVPQVMHLIEAILEDKNESGFEQKKWPGWPGENVFRVIVPVQKVGSIIGRKGEYVKKICEETKARIKILDGPPGTMERTVIISAKGDPNLLIPPALDGLLKIHKHIIDVCMDPANVPAGGTVCTRLLVPATQTGSLIGKQGATVKSIQDDSHCTIRVIGVDLPAVALPDDCVVEIQGEPAGVHKAVELIGTHLRKYLVDRSVIGIFEMQMQMPNARASKNMHPSGPSQSWGLPQPDFTVNSAHGYEPKHQYDKYYTPVDISPLDKQPRSAPHIYGRDMSLGTNTTNVQPQQALISKVSQNMQIPLSYADVVIGVNGANISYIRRSSGASIAIQETIGIPNEMTVEINGSASQVQAAYQLIQNSLAEADVVHGGPQNQTYIPFPSHSPPVYGSLASSPAGQLPTGDLWG